MTEQNDRSLINDSFQFKAYAKRLTKLNKHTYLHKTHSTITIHCPQKERLSTDGNFMWIEGHVFISGNENNRWTIWTIITHWFD